MDEGPDRGFGTGTELTLLTRDELAELVERRTAALETVTNSMIDVLLKLDDDGRIEMANDAVESILGYDPDALAGKPIDVLLADPDEGAEWGSEMLSGGEFGRLLLQDGQVPDVEVVFSTTDGAAVPMSLSTSVVDDEEMGGFVCVGKDVSERIERERLLQRKNEQLELLNQLVRHDIRNDVNLLVELIGQVRRDADETRALDSRLDRHLELMDESTDRIVDLTETARNLTEAIAELGEELEPVDLSAVLGREVANATTRFRDGRVELAGEIPAVEVRANAMLGSVFRNLLSNAIQHDDEPETEVLVSTSVTEEAVTVSIADDGPGLPETLQEAITDDDRSVEPGGASGYGLHIVETLVEQYGGTLDVEVDDPRGTTFRVTLERVGGG